MQLMLAGHTHTLHKVGDDETGWKNKTKNPVRKTGNYNNYITKQWRKPDNSLCTRLLLADVTTSLHMPFSATKLNHFTKKPSSRIFASSIEQSKEMNTLLFGGIEKNMQRDKTK